MESSKRIMLVLELDEHNHAEVVFSKELIQNMEDFEELEVVGKFSLNRKLFFFLHWSREHNLNHTIHHHHALQYEHSYRSGNNNSPIG